jgi:hypothetical protein
MPCLRYCGLWFRKLRRVLFHALLNNSDYLLLVQLRVAESYNCLLSVKVVFWTLSFVYILIRLRLAQPGGPTARVSALPFYLKKELDPASET